MGCARMVRFALLLLISLGSGVAQGGGSSNGDDNRTLVTATGAGVKCGEQGSNLPEYHFTLSLASPTTLKLDVHDGGLQEYMKFHPLKCVISDPGSQQYFETGRVLILGAGCSLNNEDLFSCLRRYNFPYPVPADSSMLKVEVEVEVNSKGEAAWAIEEGRKYMFSRGASDPSDISLEVCATIGNCKPDDRYCVPSFYFIFEPGKHGAKLREAITPPASLKPIPADADELKKVEMAFENNAILEANMRAREKHSHDVTPWYNAWEDTDRFDISEQSAVVLSTWHQFRARPAYGPYPHCPEDEKGRALTCTGDEDLTIYVSDVELVRAEAMDGMAVFDLSYKLSWGDRYAVHPCTVDLSTIFTFGKQFTVPSGGFWLPDFQASNAKQGETVISASSSLGVNTAAFQPVTEMQDELPWPKQLVLDRSYEVSFYPTLSMDWTRYPFDHQTLQLQISAMHAPASHLVLNASGAAFTHEDTQVGDAWIKDSASLEVVKIRGRDFLQITVEVTRDSSSVFSGIMIPLISVAFMDIAFHMLVSYEEIDQLFLTSAVVAGVAVQMADPSFLGIPSGLTRMPYIQCMMMMILLGSFKTMVLVVGRLIWIRRISRIEAEIQDLEKESKKSNMQQAASDPVPAERREAPPAEAEKELDESAKEKLESAMEKESGRLELYDRFLRASVPVWYISAFTIVTIDYFA